MRNRTVAILITALLLLSFGIGYLYLQSLMWASSNSRYAQVSFSWSPLQVNVTQGESCTVNGTVFNESYNQTINAGLSCQLAGINNVDYWENDTRQILNATFTPSPLFLEPRQAKNTTLTITIAKYAPIGEYEIPLQGEDNWLLVFVAPKISAVTAQP